MGGLITIQQAYLKLDRIEVTGRLQKKAVAGASLAIPAEDPPFQLSRGDSAQATFMLPSRNYEQMELHLHLFEDDYQLIVGNKSKELVPEPAENDSEGSGGDGVSDGGQEDSEGNFGDGTHNAGGSNEGDTEERDENEQEDDVDDGGGEDDRQSDDDNDKDDHESDENTDRGDDGRGDGGKNKDKENKKQKNKDDDDDRGDDDNNGNDEGNDRKAAPESNRTVDLDHFFQNAKPALVVFATYNNNGEKISVVFAVTGGDKISIPATQKDNLPITLMERNAAFVTVDPEKWFASIPPVAIESGALQNYQGQQVLFIHRDFNTPLFHLLYSRLILSVEFRFPDSAIQ